MSSAIYPWQQASWQSLQTMRTRLPHAILFHGAPGSGKTAFAEGYAQALLCQAPDAAGHACGQCLSCGWFQQYGHPDYRRVRPQALEDEPEEGGEAGEGEGERKGGKARAPSREIRIEQIRALADFMNVSTHRQGLRVVLLHPAEALNTIAANALLKTLEEPPPDTVFLLVTDAYDRLLPTIVSRCRKFALPAPGREQALQWLREQGVDEVQEWLARAGGAPLTALRLAGQGPDEALSLLLTQLARPDTEGLLKAAELLQKSPPAEVAGWMQRWLYDMLSSKLAGAVRYHPGRQRELAALAQKVPLPALLQALKAAGERRAVAEHPLAARLFIEDMLLDYAKLFH